MKIQVSPDILETESIHQGGLATRETPRSLGVGIFYCELGFRDSIDSQASRIS